MAYLEDSKYQRRKATNFIVVHASATKRSADIGVKEIREWHIKQRGFTDIGYHYVIRRDGKREMGRPTWAIGAHVEQHNWESVGICLVGGAPDDDPRTSENETLTKGENNYTPEQMATLEETIRVLKRDHYRNAQVVGHTDFPGVEKACPSFDAKGWWAPLEAKVQKEINNAQCLK